MDLEKCSWLDAEILFEESVTAGHEAYAANDPNCNELGWTCIPLAVEHYASVLVIKSQDKL